MKRALATLLFLFSSQAFAFRFIVGFENIQAMRNFSAPVKVIASYPALHAQIVECENEADLKNQNGIAFIEKESWHPAPDFKINSSKKKSRTNELPYGIRMIEADKAWPTSEGSGTRVMVIDSGIDRDHPSLRDNFEKGHNFTDDGKSKDDITDNVGHGTHVAGVIKTVAPKAKILSAKVCSLETCSNTAVVSALAWALQEKVDAINLSLGGGFTPAEKWTIDQLDSARIPVIAAAGNDGVEGIPYPAAFPAVTAVGAVDEKKQKAPFSNWGPELDLMAPGVGIYSTVPRGMGREASAKFQFGTEAAVEFASVASLYTPVTEAPLKGSLAFAGHGKPDDLKDAKDKIVLIQRGEISFLEKIKNAQAASAKAVVIANDDSAFAGGVFTTNQSEVRTPVLMIEKVNAEKIAVALARMTSVQASLEIRATNFAEMTGTSMASPFVTGVVALMRSAKPSMTSWRVRQILSSTTTPTVDGSRPGLINAKAATEAAANF